MDESDSPDLDILTDLVPIKELQHVFNFSSNGTDFFNWIASEGLDLLENPVAIGPSSLFWLLVGWSQLHDNIVSKFARRHFPGTMGDQIQLGFRLVEPIEKQPRTFPPPPYISKEGEQVLYVAEEIANRMRSQKIEPLHVFAALLLCFRDATEIHSSTKLTKSQIAGACEDFLPFMMDSGHGGAWESWRGIFNLPYFSLAELEHSNTNSTASPGTLKPKDSEIGTAFRPMRNASPEELCLNINGYAAVIAETLSGASTEHDFVLALYGPWGRGKSTLIEKAANSLEKEGYVPVYFSAWEYPTRPEVWISLYQSISREAKRYGSLQTLRIAFRVGLLKNGWSPLLWGFGLLAASRLPVIEYLRWFYEGIGLLGLLLIATFAFRSTALGRIIADRYFTLADHSEKLGMQAAIGRDLGFLLRAWIGHQSSNEPEPSIDFSWRHSGKFLTSLLALTTIAVGIEIFRIPVSTEHPLQWYAIVTTLGILWFLLVSFFLMITGSPKSYSKVLLIVDDLDRCDSEQMLAVIESLRLFVENKQMSRRLQMVMLVDKNILESALRSRAPSLESDSEHRRESIPRLLREKLFVAELMLPQLSAEDVSELAKKFVNAEIFAQTNQTDLRKVAVYPDDKALKEAVLNDENLRSLVLALGQGRRNDGRNASPDGTTPVTSNVNEQAIEVTFSSRERDILVRTMEKFAPPVATPRSLRAFVFRYQIARLILKHLKRNFDPEQLVTAIASRVDPLAYEKKYTPNPDIEWVVSQVV